MRDFSRRSFVEASMASVAALCWPRLAAAQEAQCQASGPQAFLPERLTVDCASRQNFQTFRKYSDYLGLAGVVNMTFVQASLGSFNAGNLFLFPWLKPAGQKLEREQNKSFPAAMPLGSMFTKSGAPIPGASLPPDEYFCRLVLQAPYMSFIGFGVDVPFSTSDWRSPASAVGNTSTLVRPAPGRTAQPPQLRSATVVTRVSSQPTISAPAADTWFSNVGKLADGEGVGIDWTSSNLNHPWFGGSPSIPNTAACNGQAWRQLITNALYQASSSSC